MADSDDPRRSPRSAGSDVAPALSEVMGQIARSLQQRHGDVEATLDLVTHTAVGAVQGAEGASISYVIGRRLVETRASTGALPRALDDLQNELGEGPCLDSVWDEATVRVPDMRHEDRWPRFAQGAAERGVRSSLSFQLFVEGDNLGALNLYAAQPHSFTEDSEDIGLVLASHAAVALSAAQLEENLRKALGSRDLIGQAKGILMERYKLTSDQAFALLVQASSRTNRKLADIAEELSATGTAPGADMGRA